MFPSSDYKFINLFLISLHSLIIQFNYYKLTWLILRTSRWWTILNHLKSNDKMAIKDKLIKFRVKSSIKTDRHDEVDSLISSNTR